MPVNILDDLAQSQKSAPGLPTLAPPGPILEGPPTNIMPPPDEEGRTWQQKAGRLGTTVALPIALSILTRGQVPPSVLRTALTGGAGAGLGSLAAETFDPTANPFQNAARQGIVGAATTLGAGMVPGATEGARIGERLITGLSRAGAAGTGAALGSAAAEVVDPSADPAQRAIDTGIGAGAGQALFSAAGTALGPGKRLTPVGREAAQTMANEGLPIPPTVSESRGLKLMGKAADYGMVYGRRLDSGYRQAQETLTNALDNVILGVRQGRTAEQVRADTGQLHNAVRGMVQQGLQEPTRPVYLGDAQQAATRALNTITANTQDPVEQSIRTVAQGIIQNPVIPYRDMPLLQQRADALVRMANNPQQYHTALDSIKGIADALRQAPQSEAIVDARSIQPVIQQFAAHMERYVPDSAKSLLNTIAATKPFLTFDEARTLRSDIGQVMRAAHGQGAGNVPTPTGGYNIPGQGRQGGNTIQYTMRGIYQEIDRQMENAANALGPDIAPAWRAANAATRLQKQTEWFGEHLENARDKVVQTRPDAQGKQVSIINGRRLATALGNAEQERDIYGLDFDPAAVQRTKDLAKALAFYQGNEGIQAQYMGTAPPTGQGLGALVSPKALGPLGEVGAMAAGFMYGHPVMGFLAALTPEVSGALLANPTTSRLLTLGIQLNPNSREYAALAARLAGIIQAEGYGTSAKSTQPKKP